MKTQYVFNVYSSNGLEEIVCETAYKTLWQVKQELEEAYRKNNNIKGSIIIDCIAVCNIYPYTDDVNFSF